MPPEPQYSHPIVRSLFGLLGQNGISINELERRTGMNRWTFNNWRWRGGDPTLSRMDKALRAVGYRLVIKRNGPGDV